MGSDNYTNRAAQTFNYPPKYKEQQSKRIENNQVGCFAANWDLYDWSLIEQQNEYEILQDEIKKSIEKELNLHLKNPFCLLALDIRAIAIHNNMEVPGYLENLRQMNVGNRQGNFGAAPSQGVGTSSMANPTNLGLPHNTTNLKENTDTRLGESSGSKVGVSSKQNVGTDGLSKNYAKPGQGQQFLKQEQQKFTLNEQEEIKLILERIELAKKQPSETEALILNSENLQTALKYVDRLLNQNTYHKQYILYRNYPEFKFEKMVTDDTAGRRNIALRGAMKTVKHEEEHQEEDEKKQETLNHLFNFKCDLAQDRTISCADWNPINKDLLAVSYGEFDLNVSKPGYVMFWTLKNPTYPERIIRYPTRITCCKFSESHPNLLACGTYDGVIAIYDIRKKDDKPVQENKEMQGKHSDPIWEVHWVGKGGKSTDKGEGLVSISSDGRIVEWSMKKGLEYTDLMNLKRQSHPQIKETQNEGINFRTAAGFSVDFMKGESSMYLTATEEGTIHRCSKSYSEQYLDNYFGHTGF